MKRQAPASLAVMLLFVTATAAQSQTPVSQNRASAKRPTARGNETIVDTSNWKTYRNEKHGFEVKHPETWNVHSGSGTGPDRAVVHRSLLGIRAALAERPPAKLADRDEQVVGANSE